MCHSVKTTAECEKVLQMYDKQALKTGIGDLRAFIEKDLGKPVTRGSGAWNFKCPLHGEKHGASLAVWMDHWKCFGACNSGGDAISWVMQRRGLDFMAACEALGGKNTLAITNLIGSGGLLAPPEPPSPAQEEYSPPDVEWQRKVARIIQDGQARLWSDAGERARRYLMGTRKLTEAVLKEARIGYLPGESSKGTSIDGLWVPHGILIPNKGLGNIWGLRIRVAQGTPKYRSVSGGKLLGSLYWGDHIRTGVPVIVVEGEFDALSIWAAAADLVTPVALSSANNRIVGEWATRLLLAPAIFGALDGDDAGRGAATRLAALGSRVRSATLPDGCKDPNDILVTRGVDGLRRWIEALVGVSPLPPVVVAQPQPKPPSMPIRRVQALPKVAGYLPAPTYSPATWQQLMDTQQQQIELVRAELAPRFKLLGLWFNHVSKEIKAAPPDIERQLHARIMKLQKDFYDQLNAIQAAGIQKHSRIKQALMRYAPKPDRSCERMRIERLQQEEAARKAYASAYTVDRFFSERVGA